MGYFTKDFTDAIKSVTNTEFTLDEAVKVKTGKYSWGTMKTVEHGHNFSIPLHPEHQAAIKRLNHDEVDSIKDETGETWHVMRVKDTIHFHNQRQGLKTAVPRNQLVEETEQLDEAPKFSNPTTRSHLADILDRKREKEEDDLDSYNFDKFKSKDEVRKEKGGIVHKGTYGGSHVDPEDEEGSVKTSTQEKRGRGRPRTKPLPDPNAPKRGRGRPRKNS